MATARTLIASALKQLNVLGTGETAASADENDALDWLNRMIGLWATQRGTKYFQLRTVQTLTSGTASYSIGTGGTINIVRPTEVLRAGLILSTADATPTEEPITVFTDQEWSRIVQKTLQSSYPEGVWYDHNWSAGLGLVYPWPIPNVSTTQLVLYTRTAIAVFADLTTDYTFPPGYEEAIETNLAVRLAVPFGRPVPADLKDQARAALALITRANLRLSELSLDPALSSGRRSLSRSAFLSGTR